MKTFFQVHLLAFLKDFSCCLEQFLCKEPASARFSRKELHSGPISGVLKTRKDEAAVSGSVKFY